MSNIENYRHAFISVLELEDEDEIVLEDLALGQISEWDSIAHMILISEMEDVFDVMIDSEWIAEFNSYQAGIDILTRLGVDFINE